MITPSVPAQVLRQWALHAQQIQVEECKVDFTADPWHDAKFLDFCLTAMGLWVIIDHI